MALAPGAIFAVRLAILNKDTLEKFETLGTDFDKELEKTFKQLLFDTNKYLIRVTPIDTGELRGGWTSFLDAEQEDYTRQIFDTSLAIKARGREYHITPEGIEKGKAFSTWELPNPLTFTLINSVPYGFYLEHGTSKMRGRNFLALTRYKAEARFTFIFDKWFQDIARAGKIIPFEPTKAPEIFP